MKTLQLMTTAIYALILHPIETGALRVQGNYVIAPADAQIHEAMPAS